jgi:3-dehydroquinate dehydratase II
LIGVENLADWKVLVANGVNLDLLGKRQPDVYGKQNLNDLERMLKEQSEKLSQVFAKKIELVFFQSNDERTFLEKFDQGWDAAIVNAGAWTHTSLGLADRLRALNLPYFEVHISNLASREPFRHRSFLASNAKGVVSGMGLDSYGAALYACYRYLLCN